MYIRLSRIVMSIVTAALTVACQLLPIEQQPVSQVQVESRTGTEQVESSTAPETTCQCTQPDPSSVLLASEEEIKEIQARLILLGYPAGKIDGVVGHQTRHAIKAYQADHRLLTDGRPSTELLLHIKQVAGNGSKPAN